MQTYFKICVLLIIGIPLISCSEDADRAQKLISSFQIVRFPNDGCVGSGTRNGTCYTTQECSDKGGTSAGSCADGFGVCCTFTITNCGSTTSENSTAWTMPTTLPTGATSCGLTVCPSGPEICSLRLDFTTFVITGPSTQSAPTVRRRLGTPVGNAADVQYVAEGSSYATNCMLDIFSATSASTSTTPPAVCGTLTGEHMYVEADVDRCNTLQFNLASTLGTLPAAGVTNSRGVTTLATPRSWDITVSLVECTSETLPPPGCTKYYWGGGASLTTYNFGASTVHLASQHERFCIRRERGNCIGCFSTSAAANFQVSGESGVNGAYTQGCCSYHTTATTGTEGILNLVTTNMDGAAAASSTQMGFDCAIIPGAFIHVQDNVGQPSAAAALAATITALQGGDAINANVGNVPAPPQICGNSAGLGIGGANLQVAAGHTLANNLAVITEGFVNVANMSICTRNVPFTLEFMSDDLDGLGSTGTIAENAAALNRGFQIEHTQVACSAAAG